MPKPVVNVAIGLLLHKGKVLVGWREAKQHQGNKHEFPGGKVEEGESPEDACRREIYEEVGVGLKEWHAFDHIQHEYEDIIVNLHLFHASVPVELLNLIQQPWAWYSRDQLEQLNFPKANKVILERLIWPHLIKISDDLAEFGHESGKLFYWRPLNKVQAHQLESLSTDSLKRLILNIEQVQALPEQIKQRVGTIHLKQQQLMQLKKGDLAIGKRHIAACHDLVALQHAQQIGCDAVLISPIAATPTHPDVRGLGWQVFEEWAKTVDLPVFALGGMHPNELIYAQQCGAYGLAGIRNF